MKFSRVSIFAIAAAMATPAMAQDASQSGFYAGALLGYDRVSISDGTDSVSKDGVTYGAALGYDFDLGSAIVGLEAEFSDSGISQDLLVDLLVPGDKITLSADRDIYVGARAGFKASQQILIYAKAGYTNGRAKLAYDDNVDFTASESANLDGYRIGAGVEYAVGKFRIRGEYRYSDYANYSYQGTDTGLGARRHQVVATLLGKF